MAGRGGPGCLNRFSASISGASAGVSCGRITGPASPGIDDGCFLLGPSSLEEKDTQMQKLLTGKGLRFFHPKALLQLLGLAFACL
jgi:hypothetical protein